MDCNRNVIDVPVDEVEEARGPSTLLCIEYTTRKRTMDEYTGKHWLMDDEKISSIAMLNTTRQVGLEQIPQSACMYNAGVYGRYDDELFIDIVLS